jgi:O-antigen biosynthesis protein
MQKNGNMSTSRKLLIIGTVWPEPDSSAAGSRMMQLIRLFLNCGWEITFGSASSKSDHSVNLEELGVRCADIELNHSSFDQFIKELNPDMVMFDRFMVEEQFGWRVAEQCPEALRILDTEDLHCLRNARHKAVKENREFREEDLYLDDMARREIASIYRCDLSLIISVYEYELLIHQFGIDRSLLCHLPFLLEKIEDEYRQALPEFHDRSDFVSIGNFLHEPNWDAVKWLKDEIWPLIIRKMPEAKLHVYGAYPSDKVFRLHNPGDGFLVHGRADDAFEVISNARVLLAPLRFGAGLKGKLVEAMKYGTPSITTPIGAEGISGYLTWPGAVTTNPELFAASAVELYRDETAWKRARDDGYKILELRFMRERHEQKFIDAINQLIKYRHTHRMKNFIGSMLMHHTMAGTRYMAKWIEEKNRGVAAGMR